MNETTENTMTHDEEYNWFEKLYQCWSDYKLDNDSNMSYYDGIGDKKFQSYIQREYGILVTLIREKIEAPFKASKLFLNVDIINPHKKILLDVKYPYP